MSRKILRNFMVDSYSRREGESEERDAIKKSLCAEIDKKIDRRIEIEKLLKKADDIMEENQEDKKNQKIVRELINKREIGWYPKIWKAGYLCYKLQYLKGEEVRKKKLKERMILLKRLRKAAEQYKPVGYSFLPSGRRLIIDISQLENIKKGFVAVTQMINYYCDNYGVYQYSPVQGTGYKYYSGEHIIIYFITPEMTENQIKEIVKNIKKEEIKNYKLKNTFKVIINGSKWRGCEDWRREMILDRNMQGEELDIRVEILLAWKKCRNLEELIKKWNFLEYCKNKELKPWPFEWHELTGLELI